MAPHIEIHAKYGMLTLFHFKLKKYYGLQFSFKNCNVAINFDNPLCIILINWGAPSRPPCNIVTRSSKDEFSTGLWSIDLFISMIIKKIDQKFVIVIG